MGDLEPAWDAAERALARGDLDARAGVEDAIHEWTWGGSRVGLPSWNPVALHLFPSPAARADARGRLDTWLAFLRAAIALERQPPPRDPARVALPPDPSRPGATIGLELAPDGVGYTLSSPGPTRFHHGVAEDRRMSLERAR